MEVFREKVTQLQDKSTDAEIKAGRWTIFTWFVTGLSDIGNAKNKYPILIQQGTQLLNNASVTYIYVFMKF